MEDELRKLNLKFDEQELGKRNQEIDKMNKKKE